MKIGARSHKRIACAHCRKSAYVGTAVSGTVNCGSCGSPSHTTLGSRRSENRDYLTKRVLSTRAKGREGIFDPKSGVEVERVLDPADGPPKPVPGGRKLDDPLPVEVPARQ